MATGPVRAVGVFIITVDHDDDIEVRLELGMYCYIGPHVACA